jgi:hypothetical protein
MFHYVVCAFANANNLDRGVAAYTQVLLADGHDLVMPFFRGDVMDHHRLTHWANQCHGVAGLEFLRFGSGDNVMEHELRLFLIKLLA